ncbi:MAG: heavy metal translocating P-type ATPase [Verrucomicrobiota bacterium]|nr:heavy metal translocating P-type ATPase [Verrucomicrobiota bacterium]
MSCGNCARHVTEAIQSVPGVRSASVSLEEGRAAVRWDAQAPADVPGVLSAVAAAGYEARPVETAATELLVSGMTCSNCARHVTEAIQSVPGVRNATVSLESKIAVVRWISPQAKNVPAVLEAVAAAGYQARETQTAHDHVAHRQSRWHGNLMLGIAVTVALMLGEWVLSLGLTPWFRWLSFVLAGAVQVFAGAQFYRGAWRQIKIGGSNMDTLVALGSTTAFGYSAWALLSGAGGHLYFMEAAAIITLITAGHWLEARVSDRASGALKSLLHLAPQTARKIVPAHEPELGSLTPAAANETEVPVSGLQPGDLVALRPGDRVPVDGVVAAGESVVDESTLTGESVPVDKTVGGELFAGTVNVNGRLVMRVTATGEQTALARVIAAVQRAQTSRADIQRLGDRVSAVFVPAVVAIAVLAGLWWGLGPESARQIHGALARFLWPAHTPVGAAAGFIIAAAVLIVACPCAMGLATPAAIMAAANAAARRGILVRDGVALEKAGKISAVIFDKTGTLTVGKPEVAAIEKCGAAGAECEVEKLAAALARNSTHPISQSIAKVSTEEVRLDDWREIRGAGVEARWAADPALRPPRSAVVRLGSPRWLLECGADLSSGGNFISEWSNQGATLVGLASEKNLLALFAVRDAVKPAAPRVVARLRQRGLKIFLVTGDHALTAAAIARQAGIADGNVAAEVRPEQKAAFVRGLQEQGARVAFVGDGLNDAPALTQADLGVAVSRASDVAREAADLILLNSEIEAVPEALGLARAALRTIRQNLFWAFFYNALGVPLAALGFISPILSAAAMGASDLIVIGNALRLLRWADR